MPRSRLPRALTDRLGRREKPEGWFLGSLQSQTLGILSRRGPSTVREVVDAFPKNERPAYTTAMTILVKLHEKGLTKRTKMGKGYVYEALYTPEELRDRMAGHLVRQLVDDFGDVALAHFASALSAMDRRRLDKLRRRI
ncbi:MAG: BlaI/MecI/CopY family transcriptional regulator [Chloroflexi bacterium]|nr:BlaI/MecI/CopY family transcriptional regulator [Chloroflexota bacterium]